MSKTQIDKAGESLRTWAQELGTNPNAELDPTAIEVLREYRQRFGLPLATAVIALSLLLGDPEKPGARLKREGAIIAKLVRYPHMRLSQMADIAGARAVLSAQAEVDSHIARMLEAWPTAQLIDYVAKPKKGGYRAKHLIVAEPLPLSVEIQLRTSAQNRWADEVERWAGILGYPLKDAQGPEDLVRYFEVAAELEAQREEKGVADEAVADALSDLRKKVEPYFERRPTGQ